MCGPHAEPRGNDGGRVIAAPFTSGVVAPAAPQRERGGPEPTIADQGLNGSALNVGTVTLTGAVGRRTTAAIAARLAGSVPGVVAVIDQIRDAFDGTTLARSRTHRTHPSTWTWT